MKKLRSVLCTPMAIDPGVSRIQNLILESPTWRHVLVTYSVIVTVLVVIGGYLVLFAPVGNSGVQAWHIGAWFLFCASLIVWSACTYKRSFVHEVDGCIVFVRGGEEYRRIVIDDIEGARRGNETIHFDIQPRNAPPDRKPETVIFREDEMHDNQAGNVLWRYLGKVLDQDPELWVYVRGTRAGGAGNR